MTAPNLITAFGESLSVSDWSRHPRCAVPYTTLDWRLRRGWNPETAITAPSRTVRRGVRTLTAHGETKPLNVWAQDPRCAVSVNTLKARLATGVWSIEAALSTPGDSGQSRRGTPLSVEQAAELREAAEKARRGPKVRRHTPHHAPEAVAFRECKALILAAIGRQTSVSEIARATGLNWAQIARIRDAHR